MSANDLRSILTVEDVAGFLRIGRSKAYLVCTQPSFPSFRVGRGIRIKKEAFLQWMDEQESVASL